MTTFDKHFKPFATVLDNRAVLKITDTRTMQTTEHEIGYDGKKPYFIEPEVVSEEPKEEEDKDEDECE